MYSLVLTGVFRVVAGAFLVVAVLLFGYPADAAFARDKGCPSVRGALQNRTRDVELVGRRRVGAPVVAGSIAWGLKKCAWRCEWA